MLVRALLVAAVLALAAAPVHAWKNGPPDNKVTNSAKDCADPPYSTHDWIVDHARAMLPAAARAWLDPHRNLLLIGTEAPDYAKIKGGCDLPNRGYDDTGGGKHDLRFDAHGKILRDLPARRAAEEYDKAIAAFRDGRPGHAAYFLGAAAHYIGDLSQPHHTYAGEKHHKAFEAWVGTLTPSFDGGGVFERYLAPDGLEPRAAYDAVIRTGTYTWRGEAPVLPPAEIDQRFGRGATADPAFRDSLGATLNRAVNETADMLHAFYLDVVAPAATR